MRIEGKSQAVASTGLVTGKHSLIRLLHLSGCMLSFCDLKLGSNSISPFYGLVVEAFKVSGCCKLRASRFFTFGVLG